MTDPLGMLDAMSTPEARIAAIASRQHGVIDLRQAVRIGTTEDAIRTRLARGSWRQLHSGVYVVGGAPDTPEQRLTAACLAAGPDAVASHRAGAWVWGFDGFEHPGPREITFAEGRGPLPADSIRHRTRRFDPIDRTVHNGIPVTTRERTLIDLGAVVRPFLVETAVESYLRTGGTLTRLNARIEAVAGRGCRGVGVLRGVLKGRLQGGALGSPLEVAFKRLLERNGIEPPVAQYEVKLPDGSSVVLDFAWPQYKAAVDVHGWAHHRNKVVFEGDFSRMPELEQIGWRYRMYTHKAVTRREAMVLHSLLTAIPELVRSTGDMTRPIS